MPTTSGLVAAGRRAGHFTSARGEADNDIYLKSKLKAVIGAQLPRASSFAPT